MIILSPLEQFTLFPFLLLSNIDIAFIFVILIILFLNFIPSFIFQKHIELLFTELKLIPSHIFLIITILFFILFANVLGMIPYTSTITAQGIVVVSIAIPTFLAINLLGLSIHKHNLLYLFLPAGVPLLLTPVIAVLEFISYLIRCISLTLRLTANMISGHILLKVMLSAFLSLPLFAPILLPIVILELLVAFLQAYVFILLTISYYGDVFVPH